MKNAKPGQYIPDLSTGLRYYSVRGLALCMLLFCFQLQSINKAQAQSTDQFSRSYVTPFPKGGRYKVYVVGAALAQGMHQGMIAAFSKDRRIELKSYIKYGSGLAIARSRGFNWQRDLNGLIKQDQMDILVISIGMKERLKIRAGGKSHAIGSPEWEKELGKRLDALLKSLKKKKVSIYWVGLPIMRSSKLNEETQALNDLFRKHAFINGIKFIDTWNGFADQFGRYSAFGPDINGNVRRLRRNDGVHLTERGNRKLAHFVEREIRRDLTIAKSERNIPLAGAQEEQDRIRKERSGKPKIARRYTNKKVKKEEKKPETREESFFARLQRNLIGGGKKEAKKDKSAATEVAGVRIIRPPVSDIILSGSSARNNPGSLSALSGDIIANKIGSGLTALASVTSANDLSLKEVKRRVPLKQTPYYKVLVNGEMLRAKPGRADDFSWKQ